MDKDFWPELEGQISPHDYIYIILISPIGYDLDEARDIISSERPDLRIVVEREVRNPNFFIL
jgi:hypothetical protein